ncbi:hypothetical protein HO133_001292 [Letharia lupina]|uniref:Ig-like domain-containing protein n=1 Tax=Letharia lupina TaxID=560253 RepID=A0A8H6CFC7_9LECA|nr:uncharacterized protein HO133_001292 [Letharia lupina]KAF6222206.1 hypothetical protein HO133_001292 [Letharia lupina]
MRATISIASSFPLLASLAQATWLTMVDNGGCMNVAPENLDGWKGDLDPYDEWEYKNGSRVPYTSVCSVWGIDYDNPNQQITLTLNNPINLGDRGQATLSTIWEKVYPAPSWACRPYFNCPYSAPGCTANFTWDPKLPVVYLKNFTSPTGVEDPNIVCLWYENRTSLLRAFLQATPQQTTTSPMSSLRINTPSSDIRLFATETTIITTDGQYQCSVYESTAPVLPLQVNPYYNGWGNQYTGPWPSVPWWWINPFAAST